MVCLEGDRLPTPPKSWVGTVLYNRPFVIIVHLRSENLSFCYSCCTAKKSHLSHFYPIFPFSDYLKTIFAKEVVNELRKIIFAS
jgi:hypothetical protein